MSLLLDLLIFAIYAIIGGSGLLVMKMATNEMPFSLKDLGHILLNVKYLFGFLLYACSFMMFMFILSKYKLNVAYPLATALFFVYISLASYFILKESFSMIQIIGIGLCMLGVVLIGLK